MNLTETGKSSDETLKEVLARRALVPQPETPEQAVLRKLSDAFG